MERCAWVGDDLLMIKYHDEEWGMPVHDDRKLFEFMVLDAFQAGLSWRIVLNKREAMAKAFADFDPATVAAFTDNDVERLVTTEGIIRNRQKILATIKNAKAFLGVQAEFGSFDRYIWQFVHGRPIVNAPQHDRDIPATSLESDAMSKDLKVRGFSFVGSTICYAFMQAAGLVNDHVVSCIRYKPLAVQSG